jgi:hypothetical protein
MLHARGHSLVELALLTPLLALLTFGFLDVGILFVHQLQLERMSAVLARHLALLHDPDLAPAAAGAWLVEHGFPEVESTVEIRSLPALPRAFPQKNGPVLIISLNLRRLDSGLFHHPSVELQAHAREVLL